MWLAILLAVLVVLIYFVVRRGPSGGVLVVLGSGGHTTEMLLILNALNGVHGIDQITYIVASNDTTSMARITSLNTTVHFVVRIRNVGESVFWALVRFPIVLVQSVWIVWKVNPKLVLMNGPGICIPVMLGVYFLKPINSTCATIFIESFCRVETISKTGQILYPFVDRFILQWPPNKHVQLKYPKAKCLGVLL